MSAPAALTVDTLQVELDADAGIVRAIDGLSMTLARGETFALVGESGCGKSMTALALLRLLPDNGRVVGGDVRLRGAGGGTGRGSDGGPAAGAGSAAATAGTLDLLDLPESRMRAVRGGRIGMIFQEPGTSLNPVLRIGVQVVESIETHTPLRGAAARTKAVEWLGRVGIPEPERRIDEYPFQLSGGQKQRVMIAMALAAEPELLLADEPTTALDVTIQAQILDLLRQLQREQGMGLLLITHDLAVVSQMAQTVALMYAGQIVEMAPAARFFAAAAHPYAQALLRALPDASRRGRALQAIAGTVPPLTQAFTGCRFAPRCEHAFARCHAEAPALLPLPGDGDRAVRCWLHVEGGAGAGSTEGPRAGTGAGESTDGSPATVATASAGECAPAPLLEVQDLHVRFALKRGPLQRAAHFDAVAGVSFSVPRGRTLALVGESGCGKTTTGKAIVQLLRGSAELRGRALLAGQDLFALRGDALRQARRAVQIVFQDPFASLNPRLRVAEVLEEGLLALCPELDAAARRARVAALVEQVGLRPDALQRWPHEFSGGQRQRIAIARALAVQPRLLVCDEPTSALDVSVQAQIVNLLRDLQRHTGVSYLFITHNIGVVEVLADEVAVMRAGRIVEQGEAARVLGAPTHPYTRQLIAAVPRLAAP